MSLEEIARLLEAAPGPKYKAALSAAYGAGLRVSEVVALKVSDIDSERMLLRIEQGMMWYVGLLDRRQVEVADMQQAVRDSHCPAGLQTIEVAILKHEGDRKKPRDRVRRCEIDVNVRLAPCG